MKTTGKLAKKEELRSNFKLTFGNDRGELYLILHQNKENIFQDLKIGCEYSFSGHRGRKNYYFINPQSIKLITPRYKANNDVRTFYYNSLLKELGIKELTSQNINDKLESLKIVAKQLRKWDDEKYFLTWIKEVVYSLKLKGEINGNSTHELEKFLLDIEFLGIVGKFHP